MEGVSFGGENRGAEGVRPVLDIGVCEPIELRRLVRGNSNAFIQRPEFSGPAWRESSSRVNSHALRGTRFSNGLLRKCSWAVLAVVIRKDDVELSGIVLFCEGDNCTRDGVGLIASRNDNNYARPACERLWLGVIFL